jgi:glycosyltransferase involved in cell wall biosynthesis
VVIVDNDPQASGRPICESWKSRFDGCLDYVREERPGIASARNAALAAAGEADWIAFIDDDEVPEPDWIRRLFEAQRTYGADAVTGPVLPRFEEPPPRWLAKSGFFEPARHPTGTRVPRAYTNNCLMNAARVRELGLRFDERLDLMGGEDQDFFEILHRSGCSIVWADEALAYEWVPAERMTRRWLVLRRFRHGNAEAFLALKQSGRVAMRLRLLGRGLWKLGAGAAQLPLGLVPGEHHRLVGALREMAYGLGVLYGLNGRVFQEYARRQR